MAKTRFDKSLADYLVMAVTPALIMLLVGSLVFFLLEIGYAGQYPARMRWILFWFVFATVLISRIAILHGTEYAGMFGLVLGAAMALAMFQLVDAPLLGLGLLAVVWWCVNKLTWDCTLIDEQADASGEGLLHVAGLEDKAEPGSSADSRDEQDLAPPRRKQPLWRRLLEHRPERQNQPHAPGLWVVYFSIAALPLFGLGQLLIPAEKADERQFAFQLLWVYVASALALLLATSFLGLRRYLRQRRIRMPAAIARSWIVMGAGLIVAVLFLCLLLPRPNARYSLTATLERLESEARQASRFAVVRGDKAEGEGRRVGDVEQQQGSKDGQRGERGRQGGEGQSDEGSESGEGDAPGQGQTGKSQSQQQQASSDQPAGQSSDQKAAKSESAKTAASEEGERDDVPNETSNTASSSSSSWSWPEFGWLASLLKWLVYGLLVLAGLYLLVRYWSRIVEALRQFWAALFRRKETTRKASSVAQTDDQKRGRPFADFRNPFATGAVDRMSPAELVQYSFEALEAWAGEHGAERRPDQTPLEFAQSLEGQFPTLETEPRQLALLYAQLAYADQMPRGPRLKSLEQLWRRLSA